MNGPRFALRMIPVVVSRNTKLSGVPRRREDLTRVTRRSAPQPEETLEGAR